MKKIIEVKAAIGKRSTDTKESRTKCQFDLNSAYKLLIEAYLRAECSEEPNIPENSNK